MAPLRRLALRIALGSSYKLFLRSVQGTPLAQSRFSDIRARYGGEYHWFDGGWARHLARLVDDGRSDDKSA